MDIWAFRSIGQFRRTVVILGVAKVRRIRAGNFQRLDLRRLRAATRCTSEWHSGQIA